MDLFKDLLKGILWDGGLGEKGVQESQSMFKQQFLQAQNQCIPKIKNQLDQQEAPSKSQTQERKLWM